MNKIKLFLLNCTYPIMQILKIIYPSAKVERDLKILQEYKEIIGGKE